MNSHGPFVVVLAVAALVSPAAGCFTPVPLKAADEIGRIVGLSGDDVMLLAQREASAGGRNSDEVMTSWRSSVVGAADAGRVVPGGFRESMCTVATDWLDATLRESPYDVEAAAWELITDLGASPSDAAEDMINDFNAATEKAEQGQPYIVELFFLKTSACIASGY